MSTTIDNIHESIAFFLVEIKLYQIGSSDIAVKFEVVEKPNDWIKEIKRNTSNSPYTAGKIRLLGCL